MAPPPAPFDYEEITPEQVAVAESKDVSNDELTPEELAIAGSKDLNDEFLRGPFWHAFAFGLMSWASMLPTYYLAANSSSVVVYSFLTLKWIISGRVQVSMRKAWQDKGFNMLTNIEPGPISSNSSPYFGSSASTYMAALSSLAAPLQALLMMTETVDPDMDVLAAGNSGSLMTKADQDKFSSSWTEAAETLQGLDTYLSKLYHMPIRILSSSCQYVADQGMSNMLVIILTWTAVFQVLLYLVVALSIWLENLGDWRIRRLYIPLLELGGLLYLADGMHPIDGVGHISFTATLARFMEVIGSSWFQVSLLALIIDNLLSNGTSLSVGMSRNVLHLSVNVALVQLVFSICTSMLAAFSLVKKSGLPQRAARNIQYLGAVCRTWNHGGSVSHRFRVLFTQLALIFSPVVGCFVIGAPCCTLLARFIGVWACPSHIFQVTSMRCYEG